MLANTNELALTTDQTFKWTIFFSSKQESALDDRFGIVSEENNIMG